MNTNAELSCCSTKIKTNDISAYLNYGKDDSCKYTNAYVNNSTFQTGKKKAIEHLPLLKFIYRSSHQQKQKTHWPKYNSVLGNLFFKKYFNRFNRPFCKIYDWVIINKSLIE